MKKAYITGTTGRDGSRLPKLYLIQRRRKMTGFPGEIVWDETKPDGQPRWVRDIAKEGNYSGFKQKTPVQVRLKDTIAWFREKVGEGL